MGSQLDLDQGGTQRSWNREYLGPTLGWVHGPVNNIFAITAPGSYTLNLSTSLVTVNVNGSVTITLPPATNPIVPAVVLPGVYVDNIVTIVDVGGFGAAQPIRVLPAAGDTIMGVASIFITSNYGGWSLSPDPAQHTWSAPASGTALIGGVPEAPTDGTIYGRENATWVPLGGSSAANIIVLDDDVGGSQATYEPPGIYGAHQNNFVGNGLVRHVDFEMTIEIDTFNFPNNTLTSWNYPKLIDQFDFGVYAFPFLHANPGNLSFNSYSKIEINFAIRFEGESTFDILGDYWLHRDSDNRTIETEFFYHLPQSIQTRVNGHPYLTLTTAAPHLVFYDVYHFLGGDGTLFIQVYPIGVVENADFSITSNPRLAGSVPGTPGTDPTNCNFSDFGVATGIIKTIVGSGTAVAADGTTVNYVDVRYHGPPSTTSNIIMHFETDFNQLKIGPTTGWMQTCYLALMAGNFTNVGVLSLVTVISGLSIAAGTPFNIEQQGQNPSPAAFLTTTLQKFAVQTRILSPKAFFAEPTIFIPVTTGAAIDFTIRVANPVLLQDRTAGDPRNALFSNVNYTRDITVDKTDLLGFWKACQAAGLLDGTERVTTLQLGPEIVSGHGTLYYEKFSATIV